MIASFRRILQFWRPHKGIGAALVLTMVLRAVFSVALALAVKFVIDEVIDPTRETPIWAIAVFLTAGYLVSLGAGLAAARLSARATAAIIADVRSAAFRHLQAVPLGFFDRTGVGDLIAHFSSDIAQLSRGVIRKPLIGLRAVTAMALYVPVMFILDGRLAIVAVVTVPVAVYCVYRFAPKSAPALDEEKQRIADVLDEVSANIAAQKLIRSYGLVPSSRERFGRRIEALRVASRNAEGRISVEMVISEYAVELTKVAIIVLGAVFAFNGSLDPGSFAAFAAILQEFSYQASVLGMDVMPSIKQSDSGLRRIELLMNEPADSAASDKHAAPPMHSKITISDLVFRYQPGQDALLNGVSAEFAPKSYVAIVGPNGSGKSSLLNVLLGLYGHEGGSVTVDGVDLSVLEFDDVRRRTGIASQETFLFDATIRDNITLFEDGYTESDLDRAIAAAGLAPVISRIPDGLDARLGPNGTTLSAGEAQRLGIARAVLRNPQLMLLDEVASGLDPASEADLLDAIEQLREERTIVSVTHRLDSVKTADQIIVINDGIAVEAGTFHELMTSDGPFAKMWTKQHGFDVSANGLTAAVRPERLRRIPLFASLGDEPLAELARVFESQTINNGEYVFRQGESGQSFYVIARGTVEVVRAVDTPDEQVIAYLEDGDFFGEMALLNDQRRNASVRSRGMTTLLRLDRRSFNQLLATVPEARSIVETVAERRADRNATSD